MHFSTGADLPRTVLVIPVRELDLGFLKGSCFDLAASLFNANDLPGGDLIVV